MDGSAKERNLKATLCRKSVNGMDKETVITQLKIIHIWAEFARENNLQFFTEKHLEDMARWADDALNLLKEQEEKMKHLNNITLEYEKEVFRLQTLLKEQEAQRDYEASVEMAEYCERYEQTYNPEDGSM